MTQEVFYRSEIDGLRALAIIPVVMFHLGLGFPGGFVGVDVFFVISGFLITGIIQRGLENETLSLVEFWERRIRRLFPPLFVVVAATLAAGYWLLAPNEFEQLGMSSIAQALLLSNVYFWQDTGYFSGTAEYKPLLHTWSLAVEEQFYLLFPLVLCFLRRLGRKKLFALLTAVALISFAGSVYGAFFHAGATFYLLPTRAWELLIGCMLAIFPWNWKSSPRRDSTIASLGALGIVLPVFLYDSNTLFPGLAAAPPVFGTAAIIFATGNTPDIWLRKALSLRTLTFLGLISYSLYLWHWPVIVYIKMYFGHLSWKQATLAIGISMMLAILSWKFVETPFRKKAFLSKRRAVFVTALVLTIGVIGCSWVIVSTNGLLLRFSGHVKLMAEDITWGGGRHNLPTSEPLDIFKLPMLGVSNPVVGQNLDFVLWGDSHCMKTVDTIDDLAKTLKLTGTAICTTWVPPLPNVYLKNRNAPELTMQRQKDVIQLLDDIRPKNLVLIARWSEYLAGREVVLGDKKTINSHESPPQIFKRNLNELVGFCGKRKIKLWILKQVPEAREPQMARDWFLFSMGMRATPPDRSTTFAMHRKRQAMTDTIFSSFTSGQISLIDPSKLLFTDQNELITHKNGRALYRDSNHLTRPGVLQIRPVLEKMVDNFTAEKARN